MEHFLPDFVTPPLALVALLGKPEVHGRVMEFFKAQKSPVNSIGLADPLQAARLFGERKGSLGTPHSPLGILKADWFSKQRQRRPAVALLLLDWHKVDDEPQHWAATCAVLDAVKAAVRGRGARIVVAVLSPGGAGATEAAEDAAEDAAEERAAQLCRRAGVERRQLVRLDTELGEEALHPLYLAVQEQANTYYAEAAAAKLALHNERHAPTPEASTKAYFKAAAFSEFHGEWGDALRYYAAAHECVQRVAAGPLHPLQCFFEALAVAEVVHLKMLTLTLHQGRAKEALQRFAAHLRRFREAPLPLPPPVQAAHAAWLSRQQQLVGDKLAALGDPSGLSAQREAQPAHFYFSAALAAVQRREALQAAESGPRPEPPAGVVGPGAWLGQWQVAGGEGGATRRLTDDEFVAFLHLQDSSAAASRTVLHLLQAAHDHHKASPVLSTRQQYHLGHLMGAEQLLVGEHAAAWALLSGVAAAYRREGWGLPLARALAGLLQVAHALALKKEQVALLLEVSSLADVTDPLQRQSAAAEATAALAALADNPAAFSPAAPPEPAAAGPPSGFEVSLRQPALQSALPLAFGFRLAEGGGAPLLGGTLTFCAALWTNLPLPLPVREARCVVVDAEGPRTLACTSTTAAASPPALPATPAGRQGDGDPASERDGAAAAGDLGGEDDGTRGDGGGDASTSGSGAFVLQPGRWQRLSCCIPLRAAGPLAVESLSLFFGGAGGQGPGLVWQLQSCAGASTLGRPAGGLGCLLPAFGEAARVDVGRAAVQVQSRHAPPTLQVEGLQFAVAGETLRLTAVITAADALHGVALLLQAQYSEGQAAAALALAPGAGGVVAEVMETTPDGVAAIQVAVGGVAGGSRCEVGLLLTAPREGEVGVATAMSYRAEKDRGPDLKQQLRQELQVEAPFRLSCTLSTAARSHAVTDAPEDPPLSRMGSGGGGGGSCDSVLPAGMPCVVVAHVRASAPCELQLEAAELELAVAADSPAGSRLPTPATTSLPPPPPRNVSLLDASSASLAAAPVRLRRGDVFTGLFRIQGEAPAGLAPLGHLALTWRRVGSSAEQGVASATTRLPLPSVSFAPARLRLALDCPPTIAAGQPFDLRVAVTNATPLLQPVSFAIGDSHGFVQSGGRQQTVAALPHAETVVAWRMVPYTAGALRLPDLTATPQRFGRPVALTEAQRVLVFPAHPA